MCDICKIRKHFAYPAFRVVQVNGAWRLAACRDIAEQEANKLGIQAQSVVLEPAAPGEESSRYALNIAAIRALDAAYRIARLTLQKE